MSVGTLVCHRDKASAPAKRNVQFKITRNGISYILHQRLYDYIDLPNIEIDVQKIETRIKEAQSLGIKVPY